MTCEWRHTELGEVAAVVGGGTPSTAISEYWDGGVAWITPKDLSGYTHLRIARGARDISPEGLAASSAKVLPPGSVLVSSRAPIGYVAIASDELTTNQGFRSLVLHEGHVPEFFAYLLKSATDRLEAAASGSTFTEISGSSLKQLSFPIPEFDEQSRIAGVLVALDNAIEAQYRWARLLDEALRVEGSALLRVDSETWERGQLRDHFSVARGLSYNGSGLTEGREAGKPLHNLNSVLEGGGYKFEGIKQYVGEFKERHLVHPGDLVVANTEQGFDELLIGYPAVIPTLFGEDGIFSHHLHRVRPLPDSYANTYWLYLWLIDERNHDLVAGYANGTTVNMLPTEALADPWLPIPPPERMRQIDVFVASLVTAIEGAKRAALALATVRDTLLPKLVSGSIRVSETYDPSEAIRALTSDPNPAS